MQMEGGWNRVNANRLIGITMVMLFLFSSIAVVVPVGIVAGIEDRPSAIIDDTLLNLTDNRDYHDVLVTYDREAAEFKARNAIELVDKTAKIIES
ncbi:MAG: hypothetical protein ACFE7R_09345, partial [Candidatus Hodarchaeota archaeon]